MSSTAVLSSSGAPGSADASAVRRNSKRPKSLPIGEYAAVTLLIFFGLKSIKDALDISSNVDKSGEKSSPELDEYVEAEELLKEKVSKRLSNPLEIVWKSFSLVFFAVSIFRSSTGPIFCPK